MICPHCGRTIPSQNTCPFCNNPITISSRSSIFPEAIPGLEMIIEPSARPIQPGYTRHCTVALICILLCTLLTAAWQLFDPLANRQPPLATEPTQLILSTEAPSKATSICLDANLPSEAVVSSQILPLDHLLPGQELPVLNAVGPFQFQGWNSRKDGNGTQLSGGTPFILPVRSGTTLYAQWYRNQVQEGEDLLSQEEVETAATESGAPDPTK